MDPGYGGNYGGVAAVYMAQGKYGKAAEWNEKQVEADPRGRTSRERVWSGGDIVTGSATVIEAMGAGRVAASDMHEYLTSDHPTWAQPTEA